MRDYLFTGYHDCQRAVRDDRWKLIRYPLVDQTQFFDLQADPHELKNLARDPAHAPKVAEMAGLIGEGPASLWRRGPADRRESPGPASWPEKAKKPPAAQPAGKRKR